MGYKDKITLVAMNDSLLQSLDTQNIQKENIVVHRVEKILKQKGVSNIQSIDCGSLFLNKQHNITEFLKNNLSLAEIKGTQLASIDTARNNLITKIGINPKIKQYYQINKEDSLIRISDSIKESKEVGVLLSCVANDLMASVFVNPISYAISAKIPFTDKSALERTKILLENKEIRNNVVLGLRKNIEQLLGINDEAKICTFGIYLPQILPKDFLYLFQEMNYEIENLSKEYDQSYIDISDIPSKKIDFHPNADNYRVIANRVAENLLNRFGKVSKLPSKEITKFDYETLGLNGAISDIKKYYGLELEHVYKLLEYLIKDCGYSREYVLNVMDHFIKGRPSEAQVMEEVYQKAKELTLSN